MQTLAECHPGNSLLQLLIFVCASYVLYAEFECRCVICLIMQDKHGEMKGECRVDMQYKLSSIRYMYLSVGHWGRLCAWPA